MLKRPSARTLVTVLLNCAVLLGCAWRAREVAPADAGWWSAARVAASCLGVVGLGCAALLVARFASWLTTTTTAPHAGGPGDS